MKQWYALYVSLYSFSYGLTLFPAWISNCSHNEAWGEITYPFTSGNGATVQVLEWISNFKLYFTGHVISYPCRV